MQVCLHQACDTSHLFLGDVVSKHMGQLHTDNAFLNIEIVLQVGAVTNTFNVPGVEEHCFFLKRMEEAQKLRKRINECFEIASLPGTTPEERKQLLTFVIVSLIPHFQSLFATLKCLGFALDVKNALLYHMYIFKFQTGTFCYQRPELQLSSFPKILT